MRAAWALFRASVHSVLTYRLELALSLANVGVMIAATYYAARALQPTMAGPIRGEGSDYFAFVLVGMIFVTLLQTAVTSFPTAVGGGIRSGTLEAMLATRATVPSLLAGMVAYPFAFTLLRCLLMAGVGAAVGVHVAWGALPAALAIAALTLVPYLALGLVAAAAVITWRTPGPLPQAAIVASTLLGGVYYPTRVIPGWLERLSDVLPLSYGLRAVRQVLLAGSGSAAVWDDVRMLLLMAVAGTALAVSALGLALLHARRTGTLAQY